MKIYGYKTKVLVRHEDDDFSDYPEDKTPLKMNPEEDISEVCHIYYDREGCSYIGFDLSLGLPQDDMDRMLSYVNPSELGIYTVIRE